MLYLCTPFLMDKEGLISIIVPVYNVVQYLETCVRSVQHQTYASWELLLVDDASTDGSAELCDELAAGDSRIKVIHGSHYGPGPARNKGLAAARGEFVYFIDSDDWIEPDTLETLLEKMYDCDADVVGCGVFFDYPTHSKVVSYVKSDCVWTCDEALQMIISGRLPSYLWMLLWRRSVIQEPFPALFRYEDYATGYKWFSHARRVAMTTAPRYHYVQREGSILHTSSLDKNLLDIFIERHDYIRLHSLMNERDNRANTVRNLLKLAKDFSRKPVSREEKVQFVGKILDVLPAYLPTSFRQLGLKRWLRLKVLQRSTQTFVRFV